MRQIVLNGAEIEVLFRQDPGTERDGGYQSLLVRLQGNTVRTTGVLTLTDTDLERFYSALKSRRRPFEAVALRSLESHRT